jgi:hypothetical protein
MAVATGTALLAAGAIGAGGSYLAAKESGKAAKRAAETQAAAGRDAISVLREDLAPFTGVGTEAANLLMGNILQPDSAQVTAQDVMSDPFFSALADQQQRQVLGERAALGLAGSGGTEDILTRNLLQLGEGFRQNRQTQALQQQQARFNQLFNVAGLGQASAAQQAQQTAGITTDIGAAQSAANIAQGQARGQMFSDVAGLAGLGAGAYSAGMFGQAPAVGGGSAVGGFGGIPSVSSSPLQNFQLSMQPR